ncbi:MAG: methionine--tRNA ligase subunit beta, partial [Firmicutes bacterium]|nr:methionine--tRNA ligase subunit beta [Bacillota bacterium]
MLMAAGLPLPKCVLGHGWVLIDSDKMSKSKGNVIDPLKICEKYGVEAVRYFLMREMGYGSDCNYTEELLALRINNDLANDYGNLLSRTTGMIQKFQDGSILAPGEGTEFDAELIQMAKDMPARFADLMDKMEWANALAELWKLVGKANKYIDDAAPWALNKTGEKEKLATVLYNMMEVIRLVTVMVSPVMPGLPEKVWQQIGISDRPDLFTWESLEWGKMPYDIKIDRGEPLFPRIDMDKLGEEPEPEPEPEKNDFEPIAGECTIDDFCKLDLRVVKVLECEKVPNTDKLLKFRLEMGPEERTVVSGIAQWYKPEELVGKHLVLIANLKPARIRGIESRGMLLSALHNDELKVVEVPHMQSGSKIS